MPARIPAIKALVLLEICFIGGTVYFTDVVSSNLSSAAKLPDFALTVGPVCNTAGNVGTLADWAVKGLV